MEYDQLEPSICWGVMQVSYRDRPCIAWYIHVHNLSREGFSGPSKIRASAVVSLPNMVAEL